MMTRFLNAIVLLLALLPLAVSRATHAAAAPDRPPNIILILADDLGYHDLGCYGAPLIKTPRIDSIASNGIRFTDFYVAAPMCTPSRAALMTGCYAKRVSMGEAIIAPGQKARSTRVLYPDSPYGLNPDEITIPEVLKPRGYVTGMVGKWHLGDAKEFLPTRQGFDSYFGIPYSNDMQPLHYLRGEAVEGPADQATITQRYTEESLKFIKENNGKPFFLYLAHNAPHVPLVAHPKFKGKSAGGLYGDLVEEVDDSTGQILDLLDELKLADNTLVIFFSDNGPWYLQGENGGSAAPLRAAKGSTYEGGMRIPCVMRWPGKIPAGSVCKELATSLDFLPTLADIASTQAPTDRIIDGKDIRDLMCAKPQAKTPHDAFYYYNGNRLAAVRSGQWKYKVKTTLQEETEYGKYEHPQSAIPPRLFNLTYDIGEQKSVVTDHKDIVARMEKLIDAARQDMGDARLNIAGKNVRALGGMPSTRPSS
jgi:arylsulfatase A